LHTITNKINTKDRGARRYCHICYYC